MPGIHVFLAWLQPLSLLFVFPNRRYRVWHKFTRGNPAGYDQNSDCMNASPDYYTLLGVAVDASSDEIKTAFKKLALRYHPDVYKGEDAHERMRHLLQAYQTLNDPEARKQYDSERSGSTRNGRGSTYSSSSASSRNSTSTEPRFDAARRARQAASSWARRDRQRYYDFPDFVPGHPVHIDLIDIAYTLSQQQARELVRHGLSRGVAPETEEHAYFCHRCHHRWQASTAHSARQTANGLPTVCPNCQAPDWAEYLLLRCMHCNAVFESEQIRNTIGSLSYGKGRSDADLCPPYELFPLCPYCGTAHWSQAEEERVGELRQRAARQAARMRMFMFALLLLVIVALGMVILASGR
jgi:hypothetical protein